MQTTRQGYFEKFDIVSLHNGSAQMIIVDIKASRPANPYIGVKVNGQGAAYKFGPRQCPEKIGEATEDHPALVAYRARTGKPDPRLEALIRQLVEAGLNAHSDPDAVQSIATRTCCESWLAGNPSR